MSIAPHAGSSTRKNRTGSGEPLEDGIAMFREDLILARDEAADSIRDQVLAAVPLASEVRCSTS